MEHRLKHRKLDLVEVDDDAVVFDCYKHIFPFVAESRSVEADPLCYGLDCYKHNLFSLHHRTDEGMGFQLVKGFQARQCLLAADG